MNSKCAQYYLVFSVALIYSSIAVAQATTNTPPTTGQQATDVAVLTRPQWLKRIGDAAKSPEVAKEVMRQVVTGEKIEFTQRLLKAITRMPLSPEEKLTSITQASVACIASTPLINDDRYKVIAEVIAVVPVEYLPGLIGALAKRFNPKLNSLTPEQYKTMAETTVKIAIQRNKQTDDPAVRNTFAILLFLIATTPEETPGLQALLMAHLPDDRSRELAKGWIDEALKGNYEPMLTAADASVRVEPPPPGVRRVGVAQMEGLLSDIGGLTGSFEAAARRNISAPGGSGIDVFRPADIGIQTVPRPEPKPVCPPPPCPYPNQLDRLTPRLTNSSNR